MTTVVALGDGQGPAMRRQSTWPTVAKAGGTPALPGRSGGAHEVLEVLGQAEVPIERDDTPLTLEQRVLAAEHELYPRVLTRFVNR